MPPSVHGDVPKVDAFPGFMLACLIKILHKNLFIQYHYCIKLQFLRNDDDNDVIILD